MKIYMLALGLALTGCENCIDSHVNGELYRLSYSSQKCTVRADNISAEVVCKPRADED